MSSPLPPDPYKALNVPEDATLATIRQVYRKLVLTCHPDKVNDEKVKEQKADQFHQVQQAYEILSDEQRRSRYDARVRLAKLRVEVLLAGGSRKPDHGSSSSPRSPAAPVYDTRGAAVYEERIPRRSQEDDYLSPRYEDMHSSAKRHDERFEQAKPRRTTANVSEEKRRAREYEEEERARRLAKREAEKAAERLSHATSKKTRDKGRRQDYDNKRYPHVELETESESDDQTERYSSRRGPEPKRKHEDARKSKREEPRRRHDESDFSDEHEVIAHHKYASAADYIKKSGVRLNVMDFEERRAPRSRTERIPPPPPSPPDVRKSSAPRRETSRPRGSSSAKQRTPEIVEPRYEARRPALHSSSSAPSEIKIPPQILRGAVRAATMEVRPSDKQPSSLRRSQTSPLAAMLSPNLPNKSSKLRNSETHDSGYSSSGTPELHPVQSPSYTSTKYKYYSGPDDDDEDGKATPRIIPYEADRRERELSPRATHRPERPPLTSRSAQSTRATPTRSQTLKSEPTTPRLVRSSTDRRPIQLFGEVSPSVPYKVQYSPKYEASDIQYSTRRGSADSARDHRDAYAFSEERRGMGARGSSYAQQDTVY